MTGHSLKETLGNDLLWQLAPYWARRTWQAVRRGFKPAWASRPVPSEFAKSQLRAAGVHISELAGQTPRDIGMRARSLKSLNNWAIRSRRNEANEAAAFGLDITRPLADKRAVEFGLAVPEEFYVKNGRSRYLACRALADIYPLEFQTRPARQDTLDPDYAHMLAAVRPRINLEIERLSTIAALRPYVDFDKLRAGFSAAVAGPKTPLETIAAVRALRAAQYIAWFRRGNG